MVLYDMFLHRLSIQTTVVSGTVWLQFATQVLTGGCDPKFSEGHGGHVARLPDDVPAYKALNCHINLSLGRPPSSQWWRRPVADGSINSGQITTFHL